MTKPALPLGPLEKRVALLPQPQSALIGVGREALTLPVNIVCFSRTCAKELNRPARGRALHHRHVLILALRGSATVCIDERAPRLHEGEGLLVLPFQFHDYVDPDAETINWLFITFDASSGIDLSNLRYRPFPLQSDLIATAMELINAYMDPRSADQCPLLLALLLRRAQLSAPLEKRPRAESTASDLLTRVNAFSQQSTHMPTAKMIATRLGISSSHLRTRFRESCGVSLGRHLRRLRLEKACGLLRSTSLPIAEVGDRCGFTSIYAFSRAFRQYYATSPLRYRKAPLQGPSEKNR